MKALQLEKPLHWQRVEIPEPPALKPGEAIVRVHRVGICGTDISGYLGKMPFFSYPRIPGHELGVEIVAVGAGVTNVKPGDHCAVEPYINCKNCSSCRSGHSNCCENHQTLGVHCDGGLRSAFIVPARKLHISRTLTFEQLALVETLAIGCHAIDRGNPRPGESVLVIGAGPIGLSVIEFAKIAGANTIVMDMNQQRLDFCKDAIDIKHTVLLTGDGSEVETFKRCTADGALRVGGSGRHRQQQEHESCVELRRLCRAAGVRGDYATGLNFPARPGDASARVDAAGQPQCVVAGFHTDHQADRGRTTRHAAVDHTSQRV